MQDFWEGDEIKPKLIKVNDISLLRDLIFPIGTVILISGFFFRYRDEVVTLGYYGYLGVFVSCIASNSTVLLPAPSSAIVFTFASVYSPFWVAIIGGLGAACGELIGYFAGFSGRRAVKKSSIGLRIENWFSKYGVISVFLLAFLPLPLFDFVGVLAGSSRMNLIYFILPLVVGKVFKMFIYAYLGTGIIPTIEQLLLR